MSDLKVSVELQLAATQFVSAIQKAKSEFSAATDAMAGSAGEAGSKVNQAFNTLKIRSASEIRADAERIRDAFKTIATNATSSAAEVGRAEQAMRTGLRELAAEIKGSDLKLNLGIGNGLGDLSGTIAQFASLAAAGKAVAEVFQTGMAFERIQAKLNFVTGSSKGAADEWEYLKKTANTLGLEVLSLGDAYSSFAASSKGTSLEGKKTQEVFTAVARAAAVMKLSTQDVSGAMLALGQIVSKGTVSAEELKGQLGERLPGAFQIAARSMGVTTMQLQKMLEAGSVLSNDFLPKFAEEMNKVTADALPGVTNSLGSQINLLKNFFTDFEIQISQAGLFDGVIAKTKEWSATLKQMEADGSLKVMAKDISDAITKVITVLSDVAMFTVKWHSELITVAGAVVALKILQFVDDLNKLRTALLATEAASGLLALGIKAIPVVGAFAAGYGLGTLIKDSIEANDKLKEMSSTTSMLKGMLDKVGKVKFGNLFADAAKQTDDSTKKISGSLTTEVNKIKQSLMSAQEAYNRQAMERSKIAHNLHQNEVQTEKETKKSLQELAREKEIINEEYNEEKVSSDRTALAQSNSHHGELLSAQRAYQTQLSAINSKNESAKSQKGAIKDRLNDLKMELKEEEGIWKTTQKNRAIDHKEAVAEIDRQENALKENAAIVKEEIAQEEKQLTAETIQQLELRYQEINRVTNGISTLENLALIERVSAAKQANRSVLDAATKAGNDLIQEAKLSTSAMVSVKKDEYQAIERAQEAYGKTVLGKIQSMFSGESGSYKSHYQDLANAVKQGVDKIIEIKQGMVDILKGKLKDYESEMERHAQAIKGIEEDLAGRLKSLEDVRFDIKLSGMGEAEKFNALISKGAELVTGMAKTRAEAAAKGNQADQTTIDKFKELEKEAISLAKNISTAGKDMGGAQQAEKLLDAIKVQMEAMAQTQVIKERSGIDELRVKSQDTKLVIDSLLASINKFKDFEKIELKFNPSGLDNIDDVLSKFRDLVDKDVSVNFNSNLEDVKNLLSEVVNPKDAPITVILDDSAAKAGIEALKQPTTSTHTVTVYEQRVPVHASGGLVGAFADGGLAFRRMMGSIRGAGTGTSDSIPAMLSNGEFVLRADAVKKWGTDFLYALNGGSIPKYASGGMVGDNSAVIGRLDSTVNNWVTKLTGFLSRMDPSTNKLGAFVKVFETLVKLLDSVQSLKDKGPAKSVTILPGPSAIGIFSGGSSRGDSGASGASGEKEELKKINDEIAEAQKKLADLISEFEVWREKTQGIKSETQDITEEINKLGQAITPKLDMKQLLEETNLAIEAMYASLETPAVLTVKPDAAEVESEAKSLQQPISNTLTVIPDTAGVESKINSLQQPTSSTHTVYVNTVQQNALGGLVGAFADGGLAFRRAIGSIHGPGTGTSDSIPAMLSNGEFVLRADAVKKFGIGFLNALNNGFIPAIPQYSYGGLVSAMATDTGNIDTVAIELKIGERRPLKMRSSRQTAMELSSALREIARGA